MLGVGIINLCIALLALVGDQPELSKCANFYVSPETFGPTKERTLLVGNTNQSLLSFDRGFVIPPTRGFDYAAERSAGPRSTWNTENHVDLYVRQATGGHNLVLCDMVAAPGQRRGLRSIFC